jgi:thiol-disulfide isomerase/thioredoxin
MSFRCCLVAVAIAGHSIAGEAPSPAERLAAIRKEVADAEARLKSAVVQLPDPEQPTPQIEKYIEKLSDNCDLKKRAGFAAALEIAKADPKSETGFAALDWLMTSPRAYFLPPGKPMFALVEEHYAANPKIGQWIAMLGAIPPSKPDEGACPEVLSLFKAVIEKNPDRTVRGHAAMGLAWAKRRGYGRARIHNKSAKDIDSLKADAELLFEAVIRDYGDCIDQGSVPARTLGKIAESELFQLRHLQVGLPAPNIEGDDLDGKRFKLSNYRGKVTMLVFWASWCGPCMSMVPRERELVDRFQNRPFVLIGVNGDEDKAQAMKAIQRTKINWRSFWNGKDGSEGPITWAWNVYSWPTIYLIDHKGIIREDNTTRRGSKIDEELEKLIAEAEKDNGK